MRYLALIFALIASPALAFDGLSFGTQIGIGSVKTDVPSADWDADTYGLHARYLWQGQDSNWLMGVEGRLDKVNATVSIGPRRDVFNMSADLSAIFGYRIDRVMPHALFGISYVDSSLHGSNGFHYGVGLSYAITERWMLTGRYIHREFDGPAIGSDQGLRDLSLMVSYRF